MIKIMHFCSDSNVGGAGITLFRLLSGSDKNIFEHYVVLPENSKLIKLFEKIDVKLICYKSKSDSSFSATQVSELEKIISHISPHIVHTHALASARVAALKSKVRCRIYTRHTYSEKTYSFPLRLLNRLITTKAVAVNRVILEQIKKSGIDNKNIILIENGCNCFEKHEKKSDGTFTLLYHGRVEKEKGLELVIEAVGGLVGSFDNLRLLIVGDGGYKERLFDKVKKMNLENYVIFEPYTDDVSRFICLSDVIINCSFEAEGTSNSIIEGMSAALPVIASSVKGNLSTVTDNENGLIFNTGDVADLSSCIKRILLSSELYNTLSDGAYKTFVARFRAEEMIKKYENLWKEEYNSYYDK